MWCAFTRLWHVFVRSQLAAAAWLCLALRCEVALFCCAPSHRYRRWLRGCRTLAKARGLRLSQARSKLLLQAHVLPELPVTVAASLLGTRLQMRPLRMS